MPALTLDEAQTRLREVVAALEPGEEVVLTDNGRPLAKIVKTERTSWPCRAGSYQTPGFWMAPDFDGPLDDFKEYIE